MHIIMIEVISSIHERNFEVICYQFYLLPLSTKAIPMDRTDKTFQVITYLHDTLRKGSTKPLNSVMIYIPC